MHRTAGGLRAGGLFILPGIVSIMGLPILLCRRRQRAAVLLQGSGSSRGAHLWKTAPVMSNKALAATRHSQEERIARSAWISRSSLSHNSSGLRPRFPVFGDRLLCGSLEANAPRGFDEDLNPSVAQRLADQLAGVQFTRPAGWDRFAGISIEAWSCDADSLGGPRFRRRE